MDKSGFLGNSNSGIYHRFHCEYAEKIWEGHRVKILTRDDAASKQLTACTQCSPQRNFVAVATSSLLHFIRCRHTRHEKHVNLIRFESLKDAIEAGFDRLCDEELCTMEVSGLADYSRELVRERDEI